MIAERLRKSILQAAIQGKLTEQLPEDGDARDLLVEIQAAKTQFIKDGKIKKEKALPEIAEDEIPFEIPENWCWVRFSEICKLITCGYASTPVYVDHGMPIISAKNVKPYKFMPDDHKLISQKLYDKITQTCRPEKGDILLTRVGAGIGEAAIFNVDLECAVYVSLTLIKLVDNSLINNEYILYWLNSPIGVSSSIKNIYGLNASQGNLNVKNVREFMLPIPPIAEQKRITEKIKELMPRIDSLEKDETKLKDIRQAFPKKMKDSLLQSAIQGKLTEQLESDGYAHDLVAESQKEKARLIKDKKIKKENELLEITEDEIPFEIPENWCWVRMGEVCQYIQRGKSPKYSPIKKYPVVAQKCNQWDGFHIEKAQFIEPESVASYSDERLLRDDDLMWNSTGLGTLGRMVVYESAKNPYGFAVADSHVTVIRTFKDIVIPRYILSYIVGPYIQSIVEDISSGSTKQKELATDTVKKLPIPLPPLNEQHRIVERLEQLLPLCDALE